MIDVLEGSEARSVTVPPNRPVSLAVQLAAPFVVLTIGLPARAPLRAGAAGAGWGTVPPNRAVSLAVQLPAAFVVLKIAFPERAACSGFVVGKSDEDVEPGDRKRTRP